MVSNHALSDVYSSKEGQGRGGQIGGINNIWCAQCKRSRFYMIYGNLRNQANFNENPSVRAIAKILQARASEHSSKFCEQNHSILLTVKMS